MEFVFYILAGAGVGLAIGVTGVGGGSLMTPLLLVFGFPLHIAVGTDLVYAAITKSGGVWAHSLKQSINWNLVMLLAAGSIPGTAITILCLKYFFDDPTAYTSILSTALGVMLILTALAMVFRNRIKASGLNIPDSLKKSRHAITVLMGLLLGILVTLSSVGAAVVATALLMLMYPRLSSIQVVGTNIAHAVPLTLIAGSGHAYLGNVDYLLLVFLLVGSLPAIYLGTRISSRVPDRLLQQLLITILFGVGVKFTFF